jgi:hypothetical protein
MALNALLVRVGPRVARLHSLRLRFRRSLRIAPCGPPRLHVGLNRRGMSTSAGIPGRAIDWIDAVFGAAAIIALAVAFACRFRSRLWGAILLLRRVFSGRQLKVPGRVEAPECGGLVRYVLKRPARTPHRHTAVYLSITATTSGFGTGIELPETPPRVFMN